MSAVDILEVFDTMTAELDTYNYDNYIDKLPTDVFHLRELCNYLRDFDPKYTRHLILWSNLLLLNPFELRCLLSEEKIVEIINFMCDNFGKWSIIDKTIVNIIASIIKNLAHDKTEQGDVFISKYEDFLALCKNYNEIKLISCQNVDRLSNVNLYSAIKYQPSHTIPLVKTIRPLLYYRVVKQVSKSLKLDYIKNIRIESKDTILIKRYKVKALSYQEPNTDTLNHLISYLNENNSKLGWSLSKSIVRILERYSNDKIEELLVDILKNLKSIYAHEYLWINMSHILSFSILNNRIGEIKFTKIIEEMIFYDKKNEFNCGLVRESGLFLMWCIITTHKISEIQLKFFLEYIIVVSLFDDALTCRRAASTVLLEIIGRNRMEIGEQLSNIINFNTVRRQENCFTGNYTNILTLIPEMDQVFYKYLEKKIRGLHVMATGGYIANCLVKFRECLCKYDDYVIDRQEHGIYDFYESLTAILFIYIAVHKNNKMCAECDESKISNCLKNINLKDYYDMNTFNDFVSDHLKIVEINIEKNQEFMKNNLIFLLDKNLFAEITAGLARKINDADFKQKLFTGFTRKYNEAYILANATNKDYYFKINKKFLDTLASQDQTKKAFIISAKLEYCEQENIKFESEIIDSIHANIYESLTAGGETIAPIDQDEAFTYYILQGLNNYTVSVTGDAGLAIRRISLIFIAKHTQGAYFENYFIQYFVDKSSQLRKELADAISLKDKVNCISLKFENIENIEITNSTEFYEFIKIYKNKSAELIRDTDYTNDRTHLESTFFASSVLTKDQRTYFLIGALASFRSCDGVTFKILSQLLKNFYYNDKYDTIEGFLKLKGRFLFLCLYFWMSTFEADKYFLCMEGDVIMPPIGELKICETKKKLLFMVEKIKELCKNKESYEDLYGSKSDETSDDMNSEE